MNERIVIAMSTTAISAALILVTACGGGGSAPPPNPVITGVSVSCGASPCAVQTEKSVNITISVNCSVSGQCFNAVTLSICTGTASAPTHCVTGGNPTLGTIATSSTGGSNTVASFVAPDIVPSSGETVIAKALASDDTTFGAVAISITAGTPPAWLAYTDNSDGKYAQHVYSLDLNNWDMNHPVQYEANATAGNSQDLYAAISPEGTQVAYIESGVAIKTAPIEGGTATTVKSWNAPGFSLFGVTFKRDGSGDFFVAYVDPSTGACGVATLSKDGSTWTPHTATNIACGGGSFSNPPITPAALADGSVVYSARGPNGNAQIFKLSSDLKTVTNLSNNQFNDYSLALSPDKKSQIVFTSDRGPQGLYIMNADGTNVSAEPIATTAESPAWCTTENGQVIVYEDAKSYFLLSVSPTGGSPTQITHWNSWTPACE